MKRYDSYKDSGVEWIGEIPSHWEIKPLFTVSIHSKEKNTDGEKTVLSLSYGKLKVRNVETNYGLLPDSFDNYQRVRPGYIILRLTDLQNDKHSLRVGHSYLNGIITPVYVGLRMKSNILSEYLYYHLHNSDIKKVLYSLGGGLRQTLRFDELKKFPVPLFSLGEQQQIVKFLDTKTSLIDSLIEKTQRKIELLKEKRTSLINHVVTKGLNPNVEMKDSGVEWIGEIPTEWKSIPLKYFLESNKESIRTGPFGSSLKSTDMVESGIRIYNQRTVYDEDFSKGEIFVTHEKYESMKNFTVLNGDILISSRGTIGKMTIVPDGSDIGILHPCLIRLRTNSEKVNKRFLWWYMNHSSLFIESVKLESNSTTIDVIYSNVLSEVRFPIPPLSEQEEIVKYLNKNVSLINSTISKEQKRIELLKEYRQSLISEVVTGKIKVTTDE